ncbi:MAG: division/cell wall cluster transcriptional repressor MraZ [Candidatus Doudnabacteria bacterium]|nr:division/cell wall cluster transcriptional repressor MraZ [Candidatus Doudnabacteria bacterium]
MFIGEHSLSMDVKGRIAVPVKFRPMLNNGIVITRGLDKSLFVYTKPEWGKLAEKLSQLPLATANSRAFARLMLAGAWDAEMDKQGRVIIPDYLRKFASLAKKVIMAGLYNRIEIWDQEAWEAYKLGTERESTAIAEALGELGV